MKAIHVSEYGGPGALSHAEVSDPNPGTKEVLVRIEAAGVNFIDVYHRKGSYGGELPFIPGVEASGVVAALGADVTGLRIGDRVAYAMQSGSYAQYAVVPAWKLIPLPDGMESHIGAAVLLQGMTAHYLCYSAYALGIGDTALVHAAAGGVGLLLVQIAKRCGARVIGTVSTAEKARLAVEAGADDVILYTETDFEAETMRLTGGTGVDVSYESVGQATFDKSLNCLKPRGYMVLYGQSSGPVQPIDPQVLNARGSLFLTRPGLGDYMRDRDELLARAGDLFKWIDCDELMVRIDHTFPLEEAAEAHRLLEARKSKGKILLLP